MKVFPGLIYLRIKIKTSQNVLVLICHFSSLCAFSSFLVCFLHTAAEAKAAVAVAGVLNLNCKWISSGFIDFCQRTSFPGQHSYYPFVPIWNSDGGSWIYSSADLRWERSSGMGGRGFAWNKSTESANIVLKSPAKYLRGVWHLTEFNFRDY